mmetsp:Transcript_10553/g.13090  ORF Transcript_10553/g.13090 Transcript_10553/m.13090 type:complete len:220 (-) Transcript_10553:450-1109(-)
MTVGMVQQECRHPFFLASVGSTLSQRFLNQNPERLPIRNLVQLAAIFASARQLVLDADTLVNQLADLALRDEDHLLPVYRLTLCRALLITNRPRHPLLQTTDKQLASRLRDTTATVLLPAPRDQKLTFFDDDHPQASDFESGSPLQLAPPSGFASEEELSYPSSQSIDSTYSVEVLGVLQYDNLFEMNSDNSDHPQDLTITPTDNNSPPPGISRPRLPP